MGLIVREDLVQDLKNTEQLLDKTLSLARTLIHKYEQPGMGLGEELPYEFWNLLKEVDWTTTWFLEHAFDKEETPLYTDGLLLFESCCLGLEKHMRDTKKLCGIFKMMATLFRDKTLTITSTES